MEYCGFARESSGLIFIDPNNENDVAKAVSYVLNNREKVILRQQKFAEKIFEYSWDDAVLEYDGVFGKI